MNFVDSIIHNRLEEAKQLIFERLDELATEKWEDAKAYLVNDMFEERRNKLNKKLMDKFIKPIKKEGNTE